VTNDSDVLVARFMPEGVLRSMAAKHAKRHVLLVHIAQRFECWRSGGWVSGT
jgi:hypothetical protein